MRETGGAA